MAIRLERRSPQGYIDDDPSWPTSAGAAALAFASPWDAVSLLAETFDDICRRGSNHALLLQRYTDILSALYILDKDMAHRQGSYGRLARLVERHLSREPRLAARGMTRIYLEYLAEDLQDSGSSELAREGCALEGAISCAQRRVAEMLHELGTKAMDEGHYGEACQFYRDAVALVERKDERTRAFMRCQLAMASRLHGALEESERRYGEALALIEACDGPANVTVATIHNNLGVLYRAQGRNEKALHHYERAKTMRRTLLGESHPEYGATVMNIGAVLFDSGDLDNALVHYLQTLQIWKATFASPHRRLGLLFNNIGDLFLRLDEVSQAEEHYQRAIEELTAVLGPDHPFLGPPLLGMAEVMRRTGRAEEAAAIDARGHSLLPQGKQPMT